MKIASRSGETMLTGRLKKFVKNSHGDVDGFTLEDGTVVHVPPHLGEELASTFKKGEKVSVDGKEETLKDGREVYRASKIESSKSSLSIKAPKKKKPKKKAGGELKSHDFAEQMVLVGGEVTEFHENHHGETDGFSLTSGVVVKFPPHLGAALLESIAAGDEVEIEGWNHHTPEGDVHLHAESILNIKSGETVIRHDDWENHDHAEHVSGGNHLQLEILEELRAIRDLLAILVERRAEPQ